MLGLSGFGTALFSVSVFLIVYGALLLISAVNEMRS